MHPFSAAAPIKSIFLNLMAEGPHSPTGKVSQCREAAFCVWKYFPEGFWSPICLSCGCFMLWVPYCIKVSLPVVLSLVWAVVVNSDTHTHRVFCIAFLSYLSRSFTFSVWWPYLPLCCCFPACFPEHHIFSQVSPEVFWTLAVQLVWCL